MPDLLQSLLEQDFGYLQIIANLWQVEAPTTDSIPERAALVRKMLEAKTFAAELESLPEHASKALADLQLNEGRILWNSFIRKYGEVREFGPGRREREQPYLDPVSPAEILWYHAFVSRAFMKKSGILQEFAFIPSDILELLPPPSINTISENPIFNPMVQHEYSEKSFLFEVINQSCTLLAAIRIGEQAKKSVHLQTSAEYQAFLFKLLQSAEIITENGIPAPEETKAHLESPPGLALQSLFRAWTSSKSIMDLYDVPGYIIEQAVEYDTEKARKSILGEISGLPVGNWMTTVEFIHYIEKVRPEFLRPGGNFDTWMVRATDSGEYLMGFDHWDDVEGEYIRYLIQGPLYWLGVIDLGYSSHATVPAGFRLNKAGHTLLLGSPPDCPEENDRIIFKPGSHILCPTLAPRWVRYLIARMAEWRESAEAGYLYQITPQSLAAARKQSLHVSHLVTLLRKFGRVPPPPNLIRSFQRWEDQGSEITLENVQVLRAASPEILQEIIKSKASRYLAETLGPTTIIIKPGVQEKLTRLLLDLGYLSDVK
jgi:hypothetical protein